MVAIGYNDMINESEQSLEDWLKSEIEAGYKSADGGPIKCYCGCSDLKSEVMDRNEHGILEYKMICTECNTEVGYWAYGNWQL